MDVGGSNPGFALVGGGDVSATSSLAPAVTTTAPAQDDPRVVAVLATVNQTVVALVQALTAQRALGGEGQTFEQRVLDLLNGERARYGLGQLRYSPQLDQAATAHNVQMIGTGVMAHDGIGDGTPESRIRATGFTAAWGENVAVGQTTPEQVVAEWMASPEHRRNILDASYTQVGNSYGVAASGRVFWSQSFGA